MGAGMRTLAWNEAAQHVFDVASLREYGYNTARYIFLAEGARMFYRNWHDIAAVLVAQMRLNAGRYPDDASLTSLVGELSIRSPEFQRLWSENDVRPKSRGQTIVDHPDAGELEFTYHTLYFSDDRDVSLVVYSCRRGSATEERYRLLRSWLAREPRAGTRPTGRTS